MDVFNCPNCNSLFVMTKFRDVCDACYKEEEAQYDKVYAYIRKKTNRTASMMQVVMETGVEERLIIKFVRTGKLRISQFPNLGIPCGKCGANIKSGRLCGKCGDSLRTDLQAFENEEKRLTEIQGYDKKNTYYMKGEQKG
ncbi:TIGR03826 family flagellar region protein [Peribacillus frigoritolerans]|uniref:TIGR03826 family flagellar region protein n=1 Tax=Peribacillus frigoritolerans TaxID=450367 RepID=UPI002B2512A0|nr:TIGR03826 family flagellar region protein [Peribacillus frigoritolerans]MEB2627127.1 TIGR03826 family flagellar region protein [Peribacillus frigoritolerans]